MENNPRNRKTINVLDKLPKKKHVAALEQLKKNPYAKTKADATGLKNEFKNWCINQNYLAAAENIEQNWERMTTFFSLPQEHWIHLRTTNHHRVSIFSTKDSYKCVKTL